MLTEHTKCVCLTCFDARNQDDLYVNRCESHEHKICECPTKLIERINRGKPLTREVIETDRDWPFAWARKADEERARVREYQEALQGLHTAALNYLDRHPEPDRKTVRRKLILAMVFAEKLLQERN